MTTNTLLMPTRYPNFIGDHHPERPLPVGSIVDNNGIKGTVVFDNGGDTVEVDWIDPSGNTHREEWEWILAEQVCTVISVNKAKPAHKF